MGNRQGACARVTLGKSCAEKKGTRGGKNKNHQKRKKKYGTGEELQPSNSNEGTTPEDGQPLVAASNDERNVDASKNDDVVDASENDDVVDASKNVDVVDASKTDGAGVASIDERETEFPFENLVFEGGGNKGLAYVGCLKYLEKKDFMRYIRRVGGTSAGAITAALVALGYSADEIEQFLSENIRDVFLDHSCGYLSLLPNLMRMYGWNPGRKIYRWFGDKIKVKSKIQNPDMTFMDLYKERNGKELCVVVTNVSQQRTEYFHPKTTPNVPIRVALRMSMAIPGVFAPRKYEINGQTDLYVDGGVLNNYPVNCFDGWYLSMKPSDGLFERAESPYKLMEKKSLDKFNEKTLGFLLYEDTEGEVMRPILEARNNCLNPEVPSRLTRLFE